MSRHHLLLPLAAAAAGVSLCLPAPVRAHAIESSLERIIELRQSMDRASRNGDAAGGEMQLESRFSNGLPAAEATVRLLPPDGSEPIELGRTNETGRFQFSLPAQAGSDWEIQVDAGPGHRDYLEMPGSGPAGTTGLGVAPALSQVERGSLLSPGGSMPVGLTLGLVGGLGIGGFLLRRRPRS
jgi:nickel transport protein